MLSALDASGQNGDMHETPRFAAAAALAAGAALGGAAENRTVLMDQSDFGNRLGFYLDLENRGPDGRTLGSDTIKLILGVADGKDWHYVFAQGPLPAGRPIQVRATIDGGKATLFVNDEKVGESPARLAPLDGSLKIDENPSWASAATDYRIEQGSFHAACGSSVASGNAPTLCPALAQFESALPLQVPFQASPSRPVELRTDFTIVPSFALSLDGAVDRFGQAVAADWPGKVKTEAEIADSRAEEIAKLRLWARPTSWDPFGGDKAAPWHVKPTGYYATVKHAGVWWLVSPQGYPLFYTGLCTAPAE